MEKGYSRSLLSVGKGVEAQACSISLFDFEAGKVGRFVTGGAGGGNTSLQSTKLDRLCPRMASLAMAAANIEFILFWFVTKDCQRQDVRESRAKL
jgi:hypothetical protein